jgi:hypothetical protein
MLSHFLDLDLAFVVKKEAHLFLVQPRLPWIPGIGDIQ